MSDSEGGAVTEVSAGTDNGAMDIRGILDYLPHRYPMLLIDRVREIVVGERIIAIKNVSINEPFFPATIRITR